MNVKATVTKLLSILKLHAKLLQCVLLCYFFICTLCCSWGSYLVQPLPSMYDYIYVRMFIFDCTQLIGTDIRFLIFGHLIDALMRSCLEVGRTTWCCQLRRSQQRQTRQHLQFNLVPTEESTVSGIDEDRRPSTTHAPAIYGHERLENSLGFHTGVSRTMVIVDGQRLRESQEPNRAFASW